MTEKVEKCGISRVQLNITVLHPENKVGHNGSMIHICVLPKSHKEEYCQCSCTFGWRKFHTEH